MRPKKGSSASQARSNDLAVLAAHRRRLQPAVRALERGRLAEHEIHLARRDQFAHRIDRMRRGAEGVAAMDRA